jgi:hypothetical protein
LRRSTVWEDYEMSARGARVGMIGILCYATERRVIQEFFELFKTPWEFCKGGRHYAAVMSTLHQVPETNTSLLLVFSSVLTDFDCLNGVTVESASSGHLVAQNGTRLPIYGHLARLRGRGEPACRGDVDGEVIGVRFDGQAGRVLRLGYDLFGEIGFLLSEGQPVKNASIPTLESHVSVLRDWILDAGIPLVEIPALPWGHSFIACVTHDVDFGGIRLHKFDRTFWGFVYRASVGSLIAWVRRRSSLARLARNWMAVISLPLVYLGLVRDTWDQLAQYAEIDNEFSSTFFVIPFKNRAGSRGQEVSPKYRAARYDIWDIHHQVEALVSRGHEIGVHGIDAWHSVSRGREELGQVARLTDGKPTGVRMHWLYCDADSPEVLEEAGFDYDATFGYNETVGYKGGTSQVFKPLGVARLLVLPLHIQDTALFYPGRLGLTDDEAWELCEALLNTAVRFGGVVTISWHGRSLAPDRLWGGFYQALLEELRARGAWFGSARQVVQWFRARRAVVFEDCEFDGEVLRVRLKGANDGAEPRWFLRIHSPGSNSSSGSRGQPTHMDVPWAGGSFMEIPLG